MIANNAMNASTAIIAQNHFISGNACIAVKVIYARIALDVRIVSDVYD
jgi:hypothetical protein